MRTKTPKQIFEQWDRLSNALMLKSWNGKDYADALQCYVRRNRQGRRQIYRKHL